MNESLRTRHLVAFGLLCTSILDIFLIAGAALKWTNSSHFYRFVTANRATTQSIVQVVASTLGSVHVLTLVILINFQTRILVKNGKAISLHHLNWWNRLCTRTVVFDLPWGLCVILLVFFGAITPVASSQRQTSTIQVPILYTPDPHNLYWNHSGSYGDSGFIQWGSSNTSFTPQGDFSFFPVYPYGGRILDTAASATAINPTANQSHAKYDNTRYSYSGRSYGAGSSVGLTGEVIGIDNLVRYNYSERGYKADVSCIYNASSLFQIEYAENSRGDVEGVPNILYAMGPLPNSNFTTWNITFPEINGLGPFYYNYSHTAESYPQVGFISDNPVAFMAQLSENGRNIIAIASNNLTENNYARLAGWNTKYQFLNNIQCDVTFTAKTFDVAADTGNLIIKVTEAGKADEALIDLTTSTYGSGLGILVQRVMAQLGVLSLINTSMYTSVVGDALYSNVMNVYLRNTNQTDSNATNPEYNLLGVEQAIESIFDDMLTGLASAQLMLGPSDGNYTTPAMATVESVAIGEPRYIWILTAINFLLLALVAEEALRHRGWASLPAWNYTDIDAVVLASSRGGTAIADRSRLNSTIAATDSSERVRLVNDGHGDVALTTAEADSVEVRRSAASWPASTFRRRAWGKTQEYEDLPLTDNAYTNGGSDNINNEGGPVIATSSQAPSYIDRPETAAWSPFGSDNRHD